MKTALLVSIALLSVVLLAADPLHELPWASAGDPATEVWGDLDCDGEATADDALPVILGEAGLPTEQEEFCPTIGNLVSPDGAPETPFGDITCEGDVDLLDPLLLLKVLAGAAASPGACPEVGGDVSLRVLGVPYEIDDRWLDYGDAPNGAATGYAGGAAGNFATQTADGGPQHPQPFVVGLGEFVTAEEEPRTLDDADDGLLHVNVQDCETSSALVMLNTAGVEPDHRDDPVYLSAWMDWDRDGEWSGADGCADEHAINNVALDVSDTDDYTGFLVEFPAGEQTDEFWMRLMVSTEPYQAAAATPFNGETEDYLVVGGIPGAGPGASAARATDAQPQGPFGGPDSEAFLCRGGVVPHGNKRTLTLDIEQTTASKTSGFKLKQVTVKISQPKKENGKPADGITSGKSDITLSNLADGRFRIRVTIEITSVNDPPTRLQGPFVFDMNLTGERADGKKGTKFDGDVVCGFYVDHSGGAQVQNPNQDGFTGGPGHAGDPGKPDPVFIFAPHDKVLEIKTDAERPNEEKNGSKYDKNSVTVFGADGAQIPKEQWGTVAGIDKIQVPDAGRGLRITPKKDARAKPMERITIRVEGKLPDGTTKIVDYYRIVFIHEPAGGDKFKKAVKDYQNTHFVSNYDPTQPADGAQELAYVQDGEALAVQAVSTLGLTYDERVLCSVEDPEKVHGTMFGSVVFVLDYTQGGSSDLMLIGDPDAIDLPIKTCPSVATNLTNFGPSSPYHVESGSRCGTAMLFTEYNTDADTFRIGSINQDGTGLHPVPGGADYFDPTCFEVEGAYGIVASQSVGQTTDGWFIPCPTCIGEDELHAAGLPTQAQVIVQAPEENTHVRGLAVSPDLTKIAWGLSTTDSGGAALDSDIWVADFDPATLAVTNAHAIVTTGVNVGPAWSPDSGRIAFVGQRDTQTDIFVVHADGSGEFNLTQTPDLNESGMSWQAP